jgi:hypothetical protein
MECAGSSSREIRAFAVMNRVATVGLSLVLLSGCLETQVPIGTRASSDRVVVVDIPPELGRKLDLLFVVDNSPDMAARQQALRSSFERLRGHLELVAGGLPDLHVGVISTDLGVGQSYKVADCTATGDHGALQSAPRLPGCAAPEGRFLRDVLIDGDLRERNYEGELTDTFECISQLGEAGCDFEQPLEAMRRALDGTVGDNDGFLRDNAVLAVIILTSEDDCSVASPELFNPFLDGTGDVRKYRCFRYGVLCSGDDVFEPGDFTDCQPNPSSLYVHDVAPYADFLRGLKHDPREVVVTGIMGDAALGEVSVWLDNEDHPQLAPTCSDERRSPVYPAVRLQAFLDEFDEGGKVSSLCNGDPMSALSATARQIRKALGTICMDGHLRDIDPHTPGRQVDCIVSQVAPDHSRTEMAPCDDPYDLATSTTTPCYAIKAGPAACGDFPTQLALEVYWGPGASAPAGTRVIGECLVDDPP